ncbi:hypothetical protein ALI144C_16605 [Actinosynnema sp. ALI-1.44]|uniref:tetratricopeptide repeat protein n=1 Tax=Actinosynnema sp. ALI-1.44 TaxID=1933779 RepID=UPI00097C0B5A|nr:tetratricopeptide repeat protein [Actinosynnema sp. ALI-1.44]ONI83126.1 hypothetical protein ALI144C_16605 [Actinosynnema sp. ALI-1.44]
MGTPDRTDPGSKRRDRVDDVLAHVKKALALVDELIEFRHSAYGSFQDVRRWTVADLEVGALSTAVSDYQQLINDIHKAANPWQRYHTELPQHGQELFTRYLEPLAGMAVRGFGLDEKVMAEVGSQLQRLMAPTGQPNDIETRALRADLLIVNGDPEPALSEADTVLASAPGNPVSHLLVAVALVNQLGRAHAAVDRFDLAITELDEAAQALPDDSGVFDRLADTLSDIGLFDPAARVAEHVTRLAPDEANAWNELAWALRHHDVPDLERGDSDPRGVPT